MFPIKFPTIRIFRMFIFLKLREGSHFVTYLWNEPRNNNDNNNNYTEKLHTVYLKLY